MEETFKKIDFNPMYEISNRGRLRSNYGLKECFLKGMRNGSGYKYYSLIDPGLGLYMKRACSCSRLVGKYFLGDEYFDGAEIYHLDNDKDNNCVTNLEWVTHRENIQRGYDRGDRDVISGNNHWNYGKKADRSTRRKMSLKKKGVNHPKFSGYYVVNGVEYASPSLAAEVVGCSGRTILRRCKSNVEGYSFRAV